MLQNGSKFKAVVTSFANNPLAKNVNVTVSSVTLQGANNAKVVYTVKLGWRRAPEAERNRGAPERHVEGRVREPLQARRAPGQHSVRLQVVTSAP